MAATAVWMLRKTSTGTNLWKGEGFAPPEIVMDPVEYRKTFEASFKDVVLEWGPGDFELMCVNSGMAIKAGNVAAYTLPGKARIGDASEASLTTHVRGQQARIQGKDEENFGVGQARIATGEGYQEEVEQAVNQLPGMNRVKVEMGIPQDKPLDHTVYPGLDQSGSMKIPSIDQGPKDVGLSVKEVMVGVSRTNPLPEDPADFQMLLKAMNSRIIRRTACWAQRIHDLPALIRESNIPVLDGKPPVFMGHQMVGFTETDTQSMDTEVFTIAPSDKTTVYVRWFSAYQAVESEVFGSKEVDVLRCLHLCFSMLHDACLLYLMETGTVQDHALAVFHDVIYTEMQARADFVAAKDDEYGQPTRRHGIKGVMARLFDKVARYTNLKARPDLSPKFESMADSLKDMGGYSLILAGLFQEALEQTDPANPMGWATKDSEA